MSEGLPTRERVVDTSTPRPHQYSRTARLPGLWPTLGFTWLYLSALVLIPIIGLLLKAADTPWEHIVKILQSPRTLASLRLSFGCSLIAASINTLFGVVVAWTLVRYRFFARRLFDAMVDLPFALPTSVAGITLTYLYSPHGWLGRVLHSWGIPVAFTPTGIIIALIFVGLPFVVRTVQPVVQEMEVHIEEAAHSLGATHRQTFWRVQFPLIIPAAITGFALALARAIGEYGSVLFISGNIPLKTEIAPLLIVSKLEQYDYEGAAVVASVMLIVSLALLAAIHYFERWIHDRYVGGAEH